MARYWFKKCPATHKLSLIALKQKGIQKTNPQFIKNKYLQPFLIIMLKIRGTKRKLQDSDLAKNHLAHVDQKISNIMSDKNCKKKYIKL